ncbi:MAG TPA: M23 family metallopeptidase [Flavisolibacter sp.]|nr:M23 family metallopeptidase [Flavisolibacter sp.]
MILLFACNTGSLGSRKNKQEAYKNKLTEAGLHLTTLGRQWFAAADAGLATPNLVGLPHKETGYIASDKPRAAAFSFTAKRGQKLIFRITVRPSGIAWFGDLWKLSAGNEPSLIKSIDSSETSFEENVDEEGKYIFRLQPELAVSMDYTISVSIGPSLGFPVAGKSGRIGSFWGADRDGGARSHEGIDIFAPKRTPVVAAADGTVSSVTENKLGGLVVFFRPKGRNLNLYYAHLDEQLVSAGEMVKAGDTLGLVGNTGNARTTPPHLHFGIYTMGGAIDPLPFVNPEIEKPREPEAGLSSIKNGVFRLATDREVKDISGQSAVLYQKHTIILPRAAYGANLLFELPGGGLTSLPLSVVQNANEPVGPGTLKQPAYLLESPRNGAAKKKSLPVSGSIRLHGYFGEYAFLKLEDGTSGWIPKSALR